MPEPVLNSMVRWAAIAIAMAAAVWLCYAGVIHGMAGYFAESANPEDWSRAARIEPGNAENWYRLGRYRQFDFDHADVPQAVSFYRRAVQLNPRSAYYKLDLASALEMSGDNAEADRYFRGAQQNYPISAEVSWKYGNFLLRQQRLPEAYAEIHRAVLEDPRLIPSAVSLAWHSNPDIHILLDEVLPNTAEADWSALSFLTEAQETDAALTVWNRLIAQKPALDLKLVYPFTDMLVAHQRYDEAGSAWHQAITIAGISSSERVPGSLVFNGGFERDLLGGGFGWRLDNVSGAAFDFDTAEKHSGMRSARVDFDGTQNLDYHHLHQEILVVPGTHYHFQGYLRTDQISTESGMRFELFDQTNSGNLDIFTTPNLTGTQPWTIEETDFTAGPNTHVIQIRLERKPSQRLDSNINGTVWVDDVDIVPVDPTK